MPGSGMTGSNHPTDQMVRIPFLNSYGVYEQRAMLIAMVFAVGFVLLIVCADVANLC